VGGELALSTAACHANGCHQKHHSNNEGLSQRPKRTCLGNLAAERRPQRGIDVMVLLAKMGTSQGSGHETVHKPAEHLTQTHILQCCNVTACAVSWQRIVGEEPAGVSFSRHPYITPSRGMSW
jgi:hypothetical protein